MQLNESEWAYLYILVSLGLVVFELFRSFKRKRILGKTQYRVVTRYRNFFIFIWTIIIIGSVSGELVIKESALAAIPLGIMGLFSIYTILRDNEIREKGIFNNHDIIQWSDIQYYKIIDESTVEIVTNKKTIWTKKNKSFKWDVEERKFEELLGVLEKHIKGYQN